MGLYIHINKYVYSGIDGLPVTLSLGHGFKLSTTELVKSPRSHQQQLKELQAQTGKEVTKVIKTDTKKSVTFVCKLF